MRVPEVESAGATLSELVHLLREAGAVDAVNLDGGGATQAYFMGGRVIVPGDRRGLPLVQCERMVPSVGIVWLRELICGRLPFAVHACAAGKLRCSSPALQLLCHHVTLPNGTISSVLSVYAESR